MASNYLVNLKYNLELTRAGADPGGESGARGGRRELASFSLPSQHPLCALNFLSPGSTRLISISPVFARLISTKASAD